MKQRRLGRTGLVVSEICLGTMTFGSMADERTSLAIMDRAFEAGVDFLDVAEIYPVPPARKWAGASETIVGKWLQDKPRDAVFVATKIAGPGGGWFQNPVREGKTGLDRHAIERAVSKVEAKNLLAIPVVLKRTDTNVEIEVGSGKGPAASIWIISVMQKQPVTIERGENRGKTITYHNVVRGWIKLADWNGDAVKTTQSIAELAQGGADSVVVIVQNGSVETPGPIRGAAKIALR
jgi:hypothetical protein